ncbi:MAG: response regulator [Gammaproteobacteria bacterium]|jgi:CheY-like chemotaxis protein
MASKKIACYFYPTAVAAIDDKQDYLDNLTARLSKDFYVEPFIDAFKAVEFLKLHSMQSNLHQYLTSLKGREDIEDLGDLEEDSIAHTYTSVDVFNIHKMIYDADRFKKFIVIIVDYAMPGMNGLQVCEKLKDLPYKFIMLTGEATPETVIDAFNKGLIHKYVSKSSTKFYEELTTAIFELQKNQFWEFSETIIGNLSASPNNCLSDAGFIEFFEEFCARNNIAEYYLVNVSGSFLLLDFDGNISWLVVKNAKEMEEYKEIAEANLAPQNIIDMLEKHKKTLFLFTRDDEMNIPVGQWGKYMHASSQFKGQDGIYYYSHIKDMPIYFLDRDKIFSYKKFLLQL